jgi:predicted peptidase
MKLCSLLAILLFTAGTALSQQNNLYQKRWLVQGADTLPYRVLFPQSYDSTKQYPVIFFLHGAGERGRDNEKQLTHGAKLFLSEQSRNDHPAIIIFPQCPTTDYWSNVLRMHDGSGKRTFIFLEDGPPTRSMQLLQQLVNYVVDSFSVKRDQMYVGGLSMGGMGTFELVKRMPGIFAAAFPICGGAHPKTAKRLKNVSWWIFHGGEDNVVVPRHSQEMADALKASRGSVKFTLYPNANHNSWDSAFAEPELLNWLFAQRKKN